MPVQTLAGHSSLAVTMDLTETAIGKPRAQTLIETVLDIEHLDSLESLRPLLQV